MRTKNELYQEALRTVARRRQTARAKAEDARAEAEAAVPGLRHAEEEVRVRGIRCALAGAAGKDRTDAAAALTDARKKLADLLASSGRPADALEPHFTCRLCEDTGIVDGRTCSCVHKVMQQLRRSEIEALSSLSISSFDTMELRYYPARMDASLGEPVRSYMSTLLDDLRGYADEFDTTSESLMLLGNAGLGKTHAALAIAGEVLEKGFDVIYVSSPDFFSKLEALHFGSDPAGGGRDAPAHRRRGRPAHPRRPGFRVQLQLPHQHPLQPAEQPSGREAAHHRHHQHHRRRSAGKALHRKNLQPPLLFCPLPLYGRRYSGAEGRRNVNRIEVKKSFYSGKEFQIWES